MNKRYAENLLAVHSNSKTGTGCTCLKYSEVHLPRSNHALASCGMFTWTGWPKCYSVKKWMGQRPQGPPMPCRSHMYPNDTVRDSQLKLEKCQILVYGWGDTAPCDPHQSLFRGKCMNKMRHFLHICLFTHTLEASIWAKYGHKDPRAIYESGWSESTETPVILKGLRSGWVRKHLKWKTVKTEWKQWILPKMSFLKFHQFWPTCS